MTLWNAADIVKSVGQLSGRNPWRTLHCLSTHGKRSAVTYVKWGGSTYIVMVDYYSIYFEIAYIKTPTTQSVILKMKDVFDKWCDPETVISDNGPQFASREFSAFANIDPVHPSDEQPTLPGIQLRSRTRSTAGEKYKRMRGPIQRSTIISSNTDPVNTVQSNPIDDGKTNQDVTTDHHITIRSTLACAAWLTLLATTRERKWPTLANTTEEMAGVN